MIWIEAHLVLSLLIIRHSVFLLVLHLLLWYLSILAIDGVHLVLLGIEVELLHAVDFLVKSLDLELVGVHLRLVVLKVMDHFLQLSSSLLEILLINLQSFCDFRARLLSQNILQLNIKLFLLLDQYIFFRDLLGLGNQSLLK